MRTKELHMSRCLILGAKLGRQTRTLSKDCTDTQSFSDALRILARIAQKVLCLRFEYIPHAVLPQRVLLHSCYSYYTAAITPQLYYTESVMFGVYIYIYNRMRFYRRKCYYTAAAMISCIHSCYYAMQSYYTESVMFAVYIYITACGFTA